MDPNKVERIIRGAPVLSALCIIGAIGLGLGACDALGDLTVGAINLWVRR